MQSMNAIKTMEEDFPKRNTDCVYFLASPLTCKKGIDCEYRHSEIARLNPRDCWYWLAGNCINPTCGFRHPPLEGHSQVSSESAVLPYQSSTPANNSSIPCYFYFNGFCNKGDRCSFSHGPDDSDIAGKVLNTDAPVLDHKISTESNAGADPTETHLSVSGTAQKPSKDVDAPLKEDPKRSPKTMPLKTVSPTMPLIEFEDFPLHKSGSLLPNEAISESSSPISSDESSEEKVDDHLQPEERGESSPGFDVLVDNKSEDLDYENDSEYLLAPDMERMEQFLSYELEDSVQHEARYLHAEFPYDQDVYDAYEGSDNEFISDNVRILPTYPRYRRLGSTFFHKRRRPLPVEPSYDDELGVGLRDLLRKRQLTECDPPSFLSKRSEYRHLIDQSSEGPQRNHMGRKLRERLTSKVAKHSFESIGDQGYFSNGINQHGRLKHLEPNRSMRRPYREKWLPKQKSVSSKVSRNAASRERHSIHDSTAFTGPKTLAQIKEEKRKTEEDGGNIKQSSRTTPLDFKGPKPLSEILKDKGRLDTVKHVDSSSV